MRHRHTTLALCLASTTLLAGSLATAQGASGAEQERQEPLRYVALGDSYSAATGVLPTVATSPPQCLRSERNYPHLIADAVGARLTDVSCGAADTGDFTESQSSGVEPQLDAVRRDTELVTMTIGGNDSGVFIDSMLACTRAGLTTAGRGSPCRDEIGARRSPTRSARRRTPTSCAP